MKEIIGKQTVNIHSTNGEDPLTPKSVQMHERPDLQGKREDTGMNEMRVIQQNDDAEKPSSSILLSHSVSIIFDENEGTELALVKKHKGAMHRLFKRKPTGNTNSHAPSEASEIEEKKSHLIPKELGNEIVGAEAIQQNIDSVIKEDQVLPSDQNEGITEETVSKECIKVQEADLQTHSCEAEVPLAELLQIQQEVIKLTGSEDVFERLAGKSPKLLKGTDVHEITSWNKRCKSECASEEPLKNDGWGWFKKWYDWLTPDRALDDDDSDAYECSSIDSSVGSSCSAASIEGFLPYIEYLVDDLAYLGLHGTG